MSISKTGGSKEFPRFRYGTETKIFVFYPYYLTIAGKFIIIHTSSDIDFGNCRKDQVALLTCSRCNVAH